MDEFQLRKIANKLVSFGIMETFSIIEQHGLCKKPQKYPNVIFQNTVCRLDKNKIGHWVCFCTKENVHEVSSVFYDSLGKSYISYDICVPPGTICVNLNQHQSNKSKLCSLYCLFFATLWSEESYYNTVNQLFHATSLEKNDKLVLEFYNIILKSKNRINFLRNLKVFTNKWCKHCALLLCICENKKCNLRKVHA